MSVAGASAFSCGHTDLANTCSASHIGLSRSLSVPLKRRRAFSSPGRPCRCASLSSQARQAIAAASIIAEAQTEHKSIGVSPLLSVDDRLRQLEASYKAQSAAEAEFSSEQLSTSDCFSDVEDDFVQLERSWQAQTQASTSGRGSEANSAVPFASRAYQSHANIRSKRRSSRLYAASTRRNQSPSQGAVAEMQHEPSRCPDSLYCAALRARLQAEKQKRRVSRSGHQSILVLPACAPLIGTTLIVFTCYWNITVAPKCTETILAGHDIAARLVLHAMFGCHRSLAEADAVSMFLYDLGDSSLLSRDEEGHLSRIYQKGFALEAVATTLTQQLQREPTQAELADALTDELHGMSASEMQHVRPSAFLVLSSTHGAKLNSLAAAS